MQTTLVSDTTNSSTIVIQQTKIVQTSCKICGEDGAKINLGVMTCSPCKTFFRRNARKNQEEYKCNFDGNCEINILNRHACSFCRLKKCFDNGMQTILLRAPRSARNKRTITESITTIPMKRNARDQLQQFPTLNLLNSDQYILNVDQWNLLSNLIHCYDEHSGFSKAERYKREQNILPLKIRFKISSINELLALLMAGAKKLFEKNPDFLALNSQDRSLLLHRKLQHVGGLGGCFILSHVGLFDDSIFYLTAESVYGSVSLAASKLTGNQLDSDIIFLKLVLSIVLFSTFDYTFYNNTTPVNLKNLKAVLRIQDMYIELAWQYLIYKYNHSHAVHCFSNLIRCIFTAIKAVVQAVETKQYTDMVDAIIKQTEETLSLNV